MVVLALEDVDVEAEAALVARLSRKWSMFSAERSPNFSRSRPGRSTPQGRPETSMTARARASSRGA